MQRIRFQRLAHVLSSHACKSSRPKQIDSQGDAQNADRRHAGPNCDLPKEQPLHRFPDDVGGRENEQARFEERREILDLAVAVSMIGIGWAVRDSNREIRNDRGDEIQRGMQGFGEHPEAPRRGGQESL